MLWQESVPEIIGMVGGIRGHYQSFYNGCCHGSTMLFFSSGFIGDYGLLYFLGLIYLFWTALDKEIYGNRRKSCLYIFIAMIPMIFLFLPFILSQIIQHWIGNVVRRTLLNIYEDSNESKKREEMSWKNYLTYLLLLAACEWAVPNEPPLISRNEFSSRGIRTDVVMVNAEGEFMNDLSPSVRVVDLHAGRTTRKAGNTFAKYLKLKTLKLL